MFKKEISTPKGIVSITVEISQPKCMDCPPSSFYEIKARSSNKEFFATTFEYPEFIDDHKIAKRLIGIETLVMDKWNEPTLVNPIEEVGWLII